MHSGDIPIFPLTFIVFLACAYFVGMYGFPELANRAAVALIGILIGIIGALIFFVVVALLMNILGKKSDK